MLDTSRTIIESKNSILDFRLSEVIKYKQLILLLVKRNFETRYKQTILGSAWILINPVCTTIMNTIIFGWIANLSTDNVPAPIFYMVGNIFWSLFSGCLNDSSNTFIGNAGLFGKVYFPRMVAPIADCVVKIFDFLIQLVLLIILTVAFCIWGDFHFSLNIYILLLPIVILQIVILGMGIGIIISAFTTKYRDLRILVGFGITIWMYLTPIVYSINEIPEQYLSLYMLNPVTSCVMVFKYAVLSIGYIPWEMWGYSWIFTIVVSLLGILIFNHVERTFLDTV